MRDSILFRFAWICQYGLFRHRLNGRISVIQKRPVHSYAARIFPKGRRIEPDNNGTALATALKKLSGKEFNEMMNERKKLIPKWIIQMIKK